MALKRILGDWLEKISAGAFLIGLFQGNLAAIYVGSVALLASIILRWELK